ncbi:MAG: phosphoribosylanthranilate isomerase [Elusimicrobia bacterium]|nr:phosphoribosylanthranilate isomerase [Elusimicrobiota bacterium]MBR4633135.1 phosphoribosylanthranilate isomerase [Elusimicrobiota bacterium]
MLKVKICGITNYDDALNATNLGADYLGFQLVKDSPKKVSDKLLKEVNEKLPPFVLAVGIFADQDSKAITKVVKKTGIKIVQLNGSETPEFCKALAVSLGIKVFKYMKFTSVTDVIKLQPYIGNVDYFVLDISAKDENGNDVLALEALSGLEQITVPYFITGNISSENVGEVMEKAKSFGIEADTSIERLQRRKDFNKMADFIKNAHSLR